MATEAESARKGVLAVLAVTPKDRRKAVACALVGHSRMMPPSCWGYWSCGRCEEQVGDSLGGAFSARDIVIKGHGCPDCVKNAAALTWKDRLLMPSPAKWMKPTGRRSGKGE